MSDDDRELTAAYDAMVRSVRKHLDRIDLFAIDPSQKRQKPPSMRVVRRSRLGRWLARLLG